MPSRKTKTNSKARIRFCTFLLSSFCVSICLPTSPLRGVFTTRILFHTVHRQILHPKNRPDHIGGQYHSAGITLPPARVAVTLHAPPTLSKRRIPPPVAVTLRAWAAFIGNIIPALYIIPPFLPKSQRLKRLKTIIFSVVFYSNSRFYISSFCLSGKRPEPRAGRSTGRPHFGRTVLFKRLTRQSIKRDPGGCAYRLCAASRILYYSISILSLFAKRRPGCVSQIPKPAAKKVPPGLPCGRWKCYNARAKNWKNGGMPRDS